MKPAALAAPLIIFGVLGSLLVAATPDDGQAPVAAVVAIALALALGGLWPVRREFAVAGVVAGLLFAAGIYLYATVIFFLIDDSFGVQSTNRSQVFVDGIFISLAIFGGWSFVMMIGAGIGWLVQLAVRRSAIASGSS